MIFLLENQFHLCVLCLGIHLSQCLKCESLLHDIFVKLRLKPYSALHRLNLGSPPLTWQKNATTFLEL